MLLCRKRLKFGMEMEILCMAFTLIFACAKGAGNDNIKVYRSYTSSAIITVTPPPVQQPLSVAFSSHNVKKVHKLNNPKNTLQFPPVFNPISQSEPSDNSSVSQQDGSSSRKIEAIVPVHPKTHFFAEKVSRASKTHICIA